MMQTARSLWRRATHRPMRTVMVVTVSATLLGCSSLLEVDNPNNVPDGALQDKAAADAIVTGAINTGANAMSSLLNAYTIISDETFQTGSRDDYRLLDTGGIDINSNEYLQASYLKAMQARWMAEQAIKQVTLFREEDPRISAQLLAKAYLIGAVSYDNIATMFDDAVISDRRTAGPNLGEMGMVQMYDSALKWLDLGAMIGTGDNLTNVLAMRARVKFDRAVWLKLNPPGTVPTAPLVNDAGAVADATNALKGMNGDYRYELLIDTQNDDDDASGGVGFEMNSRVEHTPDTAAFVTIDLTNKKPKAIIAKDPVTGLLDAAAVKTIGRFITPPDINHPPLTVTSKREMYLILAEAGLAAGNNAVFDTNINLLRDIDGMAHYDGTGPTRMALLQWSRRVNLVFQGRRLNDMYRFGVKDPRWIATSIVVRKPGCELPIPLIERESNNLITSAPVCQ